MESVFLVTAVVGAVEFLRRVQLKDGWAAATIFLAAVIGAVAGAFHAPGVATVWDGIVIGLGASGLVTVGQKINKGTPSLK